MVICRRCACETARITPDGAGGLRLFCVDCDYYIHKKWKREGHNYRMPLNIYQRKIYVNTFSDRFRCVSVHPAIFERR